MNIAFVTSVYPSTSRPNLGTFVQQLVWEVARQGENCTVVMPTSLFELRHGALDPVYDEEQPGGDATVRVLRPRFISASVKQIWRYNTNELSYRGFKQAARRQLMRITPRAEVLYGHFLFPSGRAVASFSEEWGTPSFSAHGDDCIEGPDLAREGKDFGSLAGIVAVSARNKKFCERHLAYPSDQVAVLPNGVDHTVFYPRNRNNMRRKHGLPLDKVLVAFVGHFSERKGPDRVLEASRPLSNVRAVMIGKGPLQVESPQIAFKEAVPPATVPELLSACDIFVLPTLNEGCCNAILEALACGMPIITAKGSYNDEIVDDSVAMRVDPRDIGRIRAAIDSLASNPGLREEMSLRAIEHSKQFNLQIRAKRILTWIREITDTSGPSIYRHNTGRTSQ